MRSRGIRDLAVDAMVDAYRVSRARHRDAAASSEPHAILVVDGDVRVRTLLLRVLEERGHTAHATDGDAMARGSSQSAAMRGNWCIVVADTHAVPDHELMQFVSRDAEVVWVSGNPSETDLTGQDHGRPVLKPLFVDDWVRLIDARCQVHSMARPAGRADRATDG
jgi:CheY-like chemotaxis protein